MFKSKVLIFFSNLPIHDFPLLIAWQFYPSSGWCQKYLHQTCHFSHATTIFLQILMALPSEYVPNPTTSHHIHCHQPDPVSLISYLDHCIGLLNGLLALALDPYSVFSTQQSKKSFWHIKSDQVTPLIPISLRGKLQFLKMSYTIWSLLLLPVWSSSTFFALCSIHTGLLAVLRTRVSHSCISAFDWWFPFPRMFFPQNFIR